jgi:DNA-binding Xre family transcriptional regulator
MSKKLKKLLSTTTESSTGSFVIHKDGTVEKTDKTNFRIKITNKIPEKVEEYQLKHGATRTWIAKKLGMSPQNMYKVFESTNLTLETLIKFSIVLGCKIEDLYEYEASIID